MRIGSTIFLIVVGAILAFAIDPTLVTFVDLKLVGYILIVAGVIGLVISLIMAAPRRQHRITESRSAVDPGTGEAVTRNETRDTGI
ncbi:hypothetical protein IV498_09320 [Paenarthrobacter sp. Z7-10]|uniref:DUF6458 family protein n=1 Tax=Paenarthrobacter sp. Z7-10 TaxID=2787635 RepID=UPI0022A905EB|nr:DUF6458 family protein [Paenarthrobacter sp. Z7-10]MCZ2403375.1 hypothetical protein [Paenarthrobacter sp. Z7-10]